MSAREVAMNGPITKKEPELTVNAHVDMFSTPDDSKYRSERKAENEKRSKLIAESIKSLTPEKAHKLVLASLEKEARRCKIEAMEYEDGPSIGEAYDDED